MRALHTWYIMIGGQYMRDEAAKGYGRTPPPGDLRYRLHQVVLYYKESPQLEV
jgi:hypothetical protein